MLLKSMFAVLSMLTLASSAFAADTSIVGSLIGIEVGAETRPEQTTVQIKNGDHTSPARKGSDIHLGDHIVTGTGSSVSLELNDGTAVLIGPNSDFSASSVADSPAKHATRLQLTYGLLHLMVSRIYGTDKSFVLTNGNSVMGVRGTEFIAEQIKDGNSVCHTLDGIVFMAKNEAELTDSTKAVILKVATTGTMSTTKKGAATLSGPARFELQQYLEKLDKQVPSMKKLRAQSSSKFSASTHPSEKDETEKKEKAAPRHGGGRRRGMPHQ